MPQLFYDDGTPSRTIVDDDDDKPVFGLIISGSVVITAGIGDQVRIEMTETQIRSLAYHATRAVSELDEQAKK